MVCPLSLEKRSRHDKYRTCNTLCKKRISPSCILREAALGRLVHLTVKEVGRMNNTREYGSWSTMLPVIALAGIAAAMILAGCAGTHARLDRSQEVFRSFQGAQVLPGHRYYTTGMVNNPDAILGIADGYTLKTERWKEREMTPELLRQLVGMMDNEFAATGFGLAGSSVLNEKGERIGIWYSALDQTTVTMISDTEVAVSPPSVVEIRARGKGGRR
jgi:hypothetical protein